MVANPFSRGLAEPARPSPARPRPVPYDPTRRRPLPRVEPLRPPPRPSGPLFPGRPRPPRIPFGRPVIAPLPAISRWWLLKLGLRALPWLNLALTAYDIYLLLKEWNAGPATGDCGRSPEPGFPQYLRFYSVQCASQVDSRVGVLKTEWDSANRYLVEWQPFLLPTFPLWSALRYWGPYEADPGFELPEEGLPPDVRQPLPPEPVPFPYPYSPTPWPNLPYSPSRPAEEQNPNIRPRPDSPLLPDPFLPGVDPTEPGPGYQPEPHTPVRPIQRPTPRPHPNSPSPEWPFPGISPEVVPGPWPSSPPPIPPVPGLPVPPVPIPSIDLGPDPSLPGVGVTPEPGFHWRIPPFREERERKRRLNGKVAGMWMEAMEKLGGSYMEYDDFVSALYKGIPWKYRRWRGKDGVWRDRDITSLDRSKRIFEYMEKYNVKVGIQELAKMWLTDKAIGKFGSKLKERTRDLGNAGLFQGTRGLGSGTPLDNRAEEARKDVIRAKYDREKKDREYWKYINMGEAGWFKRKALRPDTEIPWFRRETRHTGSAVAGQSYNRRGRAKPYYTSNRG
ncbi:MAG: hypothetical protein [Microviridae sp.]|nr:MAG: hypothetical protein [Microviridae sp.]